MIDVLKEYLAKLSVNEMKHVKDDMGETFAYRARLEQMGLTINFHTTGHFLVAAVILDGWFQEDDLLLPCRFTPEQVNDLREFLAKTNTHLLGF